NVSRFTGFSSSMGGEMQAAGDVRAHPHGDGGSGANTCPGPTEVIGLHRHAARRREERDEGPGGEAGGERVRPSAALVDRDARRTADDDASPGGIGAGGQREARGRRMRGTAPAALVVGGRPYRAAGQRTGLEDEVRASGDRAAIDPDGAGP